MSVERLTEEMYDLIEELNAVVCMVENSDHPSEIEQAAAELELQVNAIRPIVDGLELVDEHDDWFHKDNEI